MGHCKLGVQNDNEYHGSSDWGITCFDAHLIPGDELNHWLQSTILTTQEEDKDLNLSATNNTPTDKATTAENRPNNAPTDKARTAENRPTSELHLIVTFEEFEKGLPRQDYETTEFQ
jgi:hypothetical protein